MFEYDSLCFFKNALQKVFLKTPRGKGVEACFDVRDFLVLEILAFFYNDLLSVGLAILVERLTRLDIFGLDCIMASYFSSKFVYEEN